MGILNWLSSRKQNKSATNHAIKNATNRKNTNAVSPNAIRRARFTGTNNTRHTGPSLTLKTFNPWKAVERNATQSSVERSIRDTIQKTLSRYASASNLQDKLLNDLGIPFKQVIPHLVALKTRQPLTAAQYGSLTKAMFQLMEEASVFGNDAPFVIDYMRKQLMSKALQSARNGTSNYRSWLRFPNSPSPNHRSKYRRNNNYRNTRNKSVSVAPYLFNTRSPKRLNEIKQTLQGNNTRNVRTNNRKRNYEKPTVLNVSPKRNNAQTTNRPKNLYNITQTNRNTTRRNNFGETKLYNNQAVDAGLTQNVETTQPPNVLNAMPAKNTYENDQELAKLMSSLQNTSSDSLNNLTGNYQGNGL